jgi:hypothetical protein
MPKNEYAQTLLKMWNDAARRDAKIPGALIGLLAENVKTFTEYNPTWKTTPQLLEMLPRFDATRDWSGLEAIELLDELADLQDTPISFAVEQEQQLMIRTGSPLPQVLKNAPWGEALPNGLRLAWLLEPRTAKHHLGTALNSRILIHNAGRDTVVFRARTWHQGSHKAQDANGADIKVESTNWLTRAPLVPFRLAPNEFVELTATGIGIGPHDNNENWQNTRIGSWIEAKEGDEITVSTLPVPLSDWDEEIPLQGEPRWWLEFITGRLSRRLPLPADAEERKWLLYRVALELFGTPVSDEIVSSFVADQQSTALDSLAKRLAERAGLTPFSGSLQSATTTFRVLPADPNAAKKPRTAYNPGRYTLGENAVLVVVRRPHDERIVNEAHIQFFSDEPATSETHKLTLPDGYDTWVAAWPRGGSVLWVREKESARRYEFSDPASVKEEVVELDQVPAEIRIAMHDVLPTLNPAPSGRARGASPPASTRP